MKKLYLLLLLCVAQIAGAQTISEKLISVNDAKQNIKAAIASKSVDMTGVPFTEYHLSIASITSGGGDAEGTALAADVLTGKTFSNDTDIGIAGTMPDNGAVTITPGAATQTIPLGYHNGSGIVEAVSADNLYDYNIASGVEILGVTGTLEPIDSVNGTVVRPIVLGAAGIAGDLFFVNGLLDLIGIPVKTANVDTNLANAYGVSLSADGQFMIVSGASSPYLRTYKWSSVNNRYETTALPDTAPTSTSYYAAISADGQFLAAPITTSPYLRTYKWSSVNNRYETTALPDTTINYFNGTSLSADGQFLAAGATSAPYLRTYKWSSANNRYEATTIQDISPTSTVNQPSLSADGQFLAAPMASSPYLRTYKWSSVNNRYETTAAATVTLTAASQNCAVSANGQFMTVTSYNSPRVYPTMWVEANNRYEALSVDYEPNAEARGSALSADGMYLAVTLRTSPFFVTYKLNTNSMIYEKMEVADVLPTAESFRVAMSANGEYISVSCPTATPSVLTYKTDTTERLEPAQPLVTNMGYSSIPFTATMIGALLESGSASDTVNFAAFWRRE